MTAKTTKILVIEDNPGDVRLIKEMLSEINSSEPFSGIQKFDVSECSTLSDALTSLKTNIFNLVLLDLSLPDSTGIDTFKAIQNDFYDIPIIILSGNNDQELAVEAVKLGAQDYLVKGFVDSHLLMRSIRYGIERNILVLELQKAWEREQRDLEKAEQLRNIKHYLALSESENFLQDDDLLKNEKFLDELIPKYRDLVYSYIRSIRIHEQRPKESVKDFASFLASLNASAKDIVKLHIYVLNDFSKRSLPKDERKFSNDARLVLVELLGNILDLYKEKVSDQKKSIDKSIIYS